MTNLWMDHKNKIFNISHCMSTHHMKRKVTRAKKESKTKAHGMFAYSMWPREEKIIKKTEQINTQRQRH